MEALAPVFAVSLLRFDRSAPPSRSRNVIGSRMAGARRAADMAGWREAQDLSIGEPDQGITYAAPAALRYWWRSSG